MLHGWSSSPSWAIKYLYSLNIVYNLKFLVGIGPWTESITCVAVCKLSRGGILQLQCKRLKKRVKTPQNGKGKRRWGTETSYQWNLSPRNRQHSDCNTWFLNIAANRSSWRSCMLSPFFFLASFLASSSPDFFSFSASSFSRRRSARCLLTLGNFFLTCRDTKASQPWINIAT